MVKRPDSFKGVIIDKIRQGIGLSSRADSVEIMTDREYQQRKAQVQQIIAEKRLNQRKALNLELLGYRSVIWNEAVSLSLQPDCSYEYHGSQRFICSGRTYEIKGNVSYLKQLHEFALRNNVDPASLTLIQREIENATEQIASQIITLIIGGRVVNIPPTSAMLIKSKIDSINQMIRSRKVAQDERGVATYVIPLRNADDLIKTMFRIVQSNQNSVENELAACNRELQEIEGARQRNLSSAKYIAQRADSDYINFRKR